MVSTIASLSGIVASVLVLAVASVTAENILFLQSISSKSHHIWNKQIFDRLYDHGHNLTILTHEVEESVPGKTFLVFEDFADQLNAEYADMEWDLTAEQSPIVNIYFMYDYYDRSSRLMAQNDAIQRLLAYPRTFKFDLIIYDFTMGPFLLGFVDYFGNPPLVSISAFNIPSYTVTIADAPLRPAYMPHYASPFSNRMNFIERAKNILYWTVDLGVRNLIYLSNEDHRVQELFGKDAPSIKQVEKRSDIILVNGDFSMDYYQLLPPNVISVAGLHVSRSEQVPPIINQFIARANKGAILLSFGTNIGSEMLGPEVNEEILKVFRSMPDYGFIWKHGDPEILGIMPANVLVLKWVPQTAVLANPRTKLFITHGGLLSTQEATWHGVPVVAVPFMVDQYSNADKMEKAGVGVKLLPKDLDERHLKEAILRVVDDPSYRANMKERSYHFKSQPEHPLDRAIFWIEKVMQNKGLSYLRSPAHDMCFVQVYHLDLVGLVLAAATVFYLIIGRIVKAVVKPAAAGTKNVKQRKTKRE